MEQIYSISDIIRRAQPVFFQNAVLCAGVFGSHAKQTASPRSDVDFVIEMSGRPSLIRLGQLKADLEAAFDRECDVITFSSLNSATGEMADEIRRGLKIVYGQRQIPPAKDA
ncbi:MAG: nucleotidyltransferase domain-containing protein [Clostridia bacterium]